LWRSRYSFQMVIYNDLMSPNVFVTRTKPLLMKAYTIATTTFENVSNLIKMILIIKQRY
jgi:hypothetical protein